MKLREARHILEVFDKPMPWRLLRRSNRFEAKFSAIGKPFVYYASQSSSDAFFDYGPLKHQARMSVHFAELGPDGKHIYTLTGAGGLSGGMTLIATVLDITSWILANRDELGGWVSHVDSLIFSAKLAEPSRVRLYRTVLNRYAKQLEATWQEIKGTDTGGEYTHFVLWLKKDARHKHTGQVPTELAHSKEGKNAIETLRKALADWDWDGAYWGHDCGRDNYDDREKKTSEKIENIRDELLDINAYLEVEADEWRENHDNIADELQSITEEIAKAEDDLDISEPWDATNAVSNNLTRAERRINTLLGDIQDDDATDIKKQSYRLDSLIRNLQRIRSPGERECSTCDDAESAASGAKEYVEKALELAEDDKWEDALYNLKQASSLESDMGDSIITGPLVRTVENVIEDIE